MNSDQIMGGETALQVNIRITLDDRRICIATADELHLVNVKDIVHCEGKKNYTTVYLKDKAKLVTSKTLAYFEELLTGYDFCRVHQSSLVNMAFVKSFRKTGGGCVVLLDDTQIPVSTRKKDEFIKRLKAC